MSEQDVLHRAPLGHCSYCRKAVWESPAMSVVHSMYGTLRLCSACAEREPYAWTVTPDEWKNGTTLTERWARGPRTPQAKKQKRGRKR